MVLEARDHQKSQGHIDFMLINCLIIIKAYIFDVVFMSSLEKHNKRNVIVGPGGLAKITGFFWLKLSVIVI